MDAPANEPSWLLDDRFEVSGGPRSGGMGQVYRAVDLRTSSTVAVKFLAPSGLDEAGALVRRKPTAGDLRRFSRECAMHLRLGGQGVPAHIAHRTTGPSPYLVTEYVEGTDLHRFLRSNRPSFTASVSVLFQLVEVLARVHGCDVVHRDVKPMNILLGEKGEISLVDFGIALPLTPGVTRHTEGGRTPGSSGYKAPEIIRGERNPGPAADLYGAGCTFFQLVTGRLVFESDGGGYTLEKQHCEDTAPRLSDLLPEGVPPEIDDLVAHMLAKEPTLRPTAREAGDVLAPHLPRLGTLPPIPLLSPDPTLPFREGSQTASSGSLITPAARSSSSARPAVRRQPPGHVTRAELRETLSAASREVRQGEPGENVRHLATLLDKARRKWSDGDREVLTSMLICADSARIVGDVLTAGSHYRTVERLTDTVSPDSPLFSIALTARLGAAECRLAEDEEGGMVLAVWLEACKTLIAMGRSAPADLVDRCLETGADLAERGHAETVASWSRRLSAR
ncbi:serine/threonine-protein kinase [Streptomyces sp. NPDC035033]|uniref:serine/threonine protein kinase n=1 Tax=Streptomyces sp. NPDC035033 TaxID=3155368 RepID=UPI0033F8BDA3